MNPDSNAVVTPGQPGPRPATVRWMKFVRRIHMFAGLFMLPWVLVYGVSALVFNHNSWFYPNAKKNASAPQVREVDELPATAWQRGPLAGVGTAESLAASVLKEINQSLTNANVAWTLAGDAAARFTRTLVLESANGSTNLEVQINFDEQSGTLTRRITGAKDPAQRPAAETRHFDPPAAEIFNGDWSKELAQQLAPTEGTVRLDLKPFRVKNAPELVFNADAEGRRWNIRCNLVNGEVTAREAGQGAGFVARTAGFITRLHKARGYPNNSEVTIRWWWALLVDAMAFLMLLWGLSGLAMWWQMKGQRKWGAITLAACGVVTWLIWTGMQTVLR